MLDPLARRALGLEQARVLDRKRRPVGDELEQLDLIVLEGAEPERADMEDAAHLSLHHERDAEHRLDPLLAQERVEDVRMIDVVEDYRKIHGERPDNPKVIAISIDTNDTHSTAAALIGTIAFMSR